MEIKSFERGFSYWDFLITPITFVILNPSFCMSFVIMQSNFCDYAIEHQNIL